MTTKSSQDITQLLAAWSDGNADAVNRLVAVVYPELRRIARQQLGRRPAEHTLQSAALANEAYLKLIQIQGVHCENRAHFFALCAQIIRRILVDYARKQRYIKRGGDAIRVTLDEAGVRLPVRDPEVLALDEALMTLAEIDPRKSRVVELRYFGGLNVEETAVVLHISPETV